MTNVTRITQKQAEAEVKKGAGKISETDVRNILDQKAKIEKKFQKNGPLTRFISDLKLFFAVIRDYAGGHYREIPWWSLAAIVTALIYVLNPVDLIPDFIPGIGYIDDAMVVAACLKMVEQDLHEYKCWKQKWI